MLIILFYIKWSSRHDKWWTLHTHQNCCQQNGPAPKLSTQHHRISPNYGSLTKYFYSTKTLYHQSLRRSTDDLAGRPLRFYRALAGIHTQHMHMIASALERHLAGARRKDVAVQRLRWSVLMLRCTKSIKRQIIIGDRPWNVDHRVCRFSYFARLNGRYDRGISSSSHF